LRLGGEAHPRGAMSSRRNTLHPSTVIEVGSDLLPAAGLSHVSALQTFQHNLPLLLQVFALSSLLSIERNGGILRGRLRLMHKLDRAFDGTTEPVACAKRARS
jgi:hypothetical protein